MKLLTLDAFINKYNGKYVDWDKAYGPQCVDLIRFYQQEVLGVPPEAIPASPTARQMFLSFPSENKWFTKIISPYGDPQIPQKGDIFFFGYPYGFYMNGFIPTFAGHVCIVSGASEFQFISFDQNWGKPDFCRFVNHNYKGSLGWLRPKKA